MSDLSFDCQSDAYRAAAGRASEIERLRNLHRQVSAVRKGETILGEVIHYRTHGIKVRMPKAVALRLLSTEIARKEAELAEIKALFK